MKSKYYESDPVPFSMNKDQYIQGVRDQVPVFERFEGFVELRQVIDFVASDDERTRVQTNMNDKTDYFPTKKFKITVDSAKVMANGVVKPENADQIVQEIKWSISSNYVMKNDMMILDLFATSDWERPIYFVSVGSGNETNMKDYFQLEGFASRFVPIKTPYDYLNTGRVDTDILWDNLMNKFQWGNIGDPKVYLNENTRRTIRIVKVRNNFGRLAKSLNAEGDKARAQEALNRCLEILPADKMKIEYYDSQFVEAFFEVGMNEEGKEIALQMANTALKDMEYFVKFDTKFGKVSDQDKQLAFVTVQWLNDVARRYKQEELSAELNKTFEEIYQMFVSVQ
jgi:hypothetical protein